MSFSVDSFVASPKLTSIGPLRKAELLSLAQYYKLEVSQGMKKAEIRTMIVEYLIEEEIVSEDEGLLSTNTVELKRLELQDKEREREAQLKLKEMELRERELAIQLKMKELEVAAASPPTPTREPAGLDVSKYVRFVPPFQEKEVDKYFLHFEKVASSLLWPKEMWTLLLQSSLLGKAHEAYSALSVDQSSDYDTVKRSILKAYELVPEAYRQRFRATEKTNAQTFVEFARAKETLFDHWCTSKEVNGDFGRLRQLMLMEEFKSCVPSEIRTYLDEQKMESLHEVAMHADDYSLTHAVSFGKSQCSSPADTKLEVTKGGPPGHSNSSGESQSGNTSSNRLPAGPTCFYCRKKGHVMSECRALQRKNDKPGKHNLLVSPGDQPDDKNKQPCTWPEEYTPFVSCGSASFVGSHMEFPITILRDTGASQSLMWEGALPFNRQSDTGMTVLLQGVELETFCVPLHKVYLKCNLVNGQAVVGVRPSLPIQGVSLILGNDLAGGRVVANPYVSNVPHQDAAVEHVDGVLGLFPAFAVTRAMAKRAANQKDVDIFSLNDKALGHGVGTVPDAHCQLGLVPPPGASEQAPTKVFDDIGSPHLSREDLIKEQESDLEIRRLGQLAVNEQEVAVMPRCYFHKDGILMRKWRPSDVPASHEWKVVYQVVLPPVYREDILKLAHETPMVGHLGVNKTYRRVLDHFFWPGVRKDVRHFCRTCDTCQMVGKSNQKPPPAPLKPIPVVAEPFSTVVIDCVGPLPKTKDGNQYLLTMMCASTRFPEAIPLRDIKTPKVIKALIKFFTLVGLPKVIQLDQGSNFMSSLFTVCSQGSHSGIFRV